MPTLASIGKTYSGESATAALQTNLPDLRRATALSIVHSWSDCKLEPCNSDFDDVKRRLEDTLMPDDYCWDMGEDSWG